MGWEGIGFRRSGVWAVGLIAAVWGGVASAAPGVNNILVQTGLTAPDFNGTYSSFFSPTLNDAGQVAFSSALTGTSGGITDNSGLYVVGDGGDTQIAREGQAVPGGNGTFSSLFIVPQFNQSGQVAFLANLSGTTGGTTDNSAVYLFNGGGLTQVVREGQSSPDGNGTFEGFGNPVLNDLGQVAVSGFLTGTSGSFFDDSGVYRGSGGTLTQISREDQAAPDGNGVLSGGLFDIRINDVGGVVFNSFVSGTTGGGTDNEGIFLGSGGALTQVIRKGQAAPDGNGVVSSLFEPAVNNSGQVAVYTFLDGTSNGGADDRALYLSSGGTLARIAREGESAPDGNGTFLAFSASPALNDAGQTVFTATLTNTIGGADDNSGIYRGSGGVVTQLVREGEAAPDNNGSFFSFFTPVINEEGYALYRASLTGTVGGPTDSEGLFLSNGIETLQILRKGDALAGSVINTISPAANGINNSGQIAYEASLSDGTEVIGRFDLTTERRWDERGSGLWSTDANWTGDIEPNSFTDVFLTPDGGATITGDFQNTYAKSLTVGSVLSGQTVLNLNNGGDLESLGEIVVNGRGKIEVGLDRILTAPTLLNSGQLTGDGQIDAAITNLTDGVIRAEAGQSLQITGFGPTNFGRIESLFGELEFTGTVNNESFSGVISGENATYRFNGGLTNRGAVALSFGTSRVYGDVMNLSTGRVLVSGNSDATFYDDVDNSGVINVSAGSTAVFFGSVSGNGVSGAGTVFLEGDTRPGFSPGVMSFGGDVNLGFFHTLGVELAGETPGSEHDQLDIAGVAVLGGTLEVSLLNAFAPTAGQRFDIVTAAGGVTGTFDQEVLPTLSGGLSWDVLYEANAVALSVVSAILAGDYNGNGVVDAADYTVWADNFGSTAALAADGNGNGVVDAADYTIWADNFGTSAAVSQGFTLIPEPSTLVWLVFCGPALVRRCRRIG